MKKLVIGGVVGFFAGWAVRAVFDSGREVMVSLAASAYGARDAARRVVGFEKEYFEDLIAEGKARWESTRGRRAGGADT
jgi:uncharacterized membrane protein (Fun14 family)